MYVWLCSMLKVNNWPYQCSPAHNSGYSDFMSLGMSSGNIKIAPSIEKHAQARATLQKLLSGLRVKYGWRLPRSNTMTRSSAGEAREHRKAAQRQTKEDIYTSQNGGAPGRDHARLQCCLQCCLLQWTAFNRAHIYSRHGMRHSRETTTPLGSVRGRLPPGQPCCEDINSL